MHPTASQIGVVLIEALKKRSQALLVAAKGSQAQTMLTLPISGSSVDYDVEARVADPNNHTESHTFPSHDSTTSLSKASYISPRAAPLLHLLTQHNTVL